MLRIEGWGVNHKRVERIWRQEGLKVPQRQPKRGRLWLNDGSCIRLRPLYRGHVWSWMVVCARRVREIGSWAKLADEVEDLPMIQPQAQLEDKKGDGRGHERRHAIAQALSQ